MRIGCRVTASAVHAAPFLAVGPCRGVTPAHAADGRDARTAGVAGVQSPTCVRRVTSRPGNLGGRSKRSPRDGGRTLHGFQCAPGDRGPGKLAVADRLEFGTARGGFMPAIRDHGADRPPQPATSPGVHPWTRGTGERRSSPNFAATARVSPKCVASCYYAAAACPDRPWPASPSLATATLAGRNALGTGAPAGFSLTRPLAFPSPAGQPQLEPARGPPPAAGPNIARREAPVGDGQLLSPER